MTAFDVEAVRALCDADHLHAQPWLAGGNDTIEGDGGSADSDLCVFVDCPAGGADAITVLFDGDWATNADAEFIAQARTLLPAACDRIRELTAALRAIAKATEKIEALPPGMVLSVASIVRGVL